MTGPGQDSKKHKPDDAAKYLAESFFGLNLNPAEVGGEVLFDDYDDNQTPKMQLDTEPLASDDRTEAIQALVSSGTTGSTVHDVPNRFEENLDDLIVFSDDDDDVTLQDEDDDENFDFGDDDDDDDDEDDDEVEEEDDEEDFDDEDEDDEEEEDELDDEDLDFGSDVIDPAPGKSVPVARDSRSARDERGTDSRPAPARSHAPGPGRPAAEQRPASGQRGERRDERPAARSSRPQESSAARADSRGSERPPAKAVDAGRKTTSSDEDYWKELDGWVWDDDAPKKPVASASRVPDADEIDDDDDDDDIIVSAAPAAEDDDGEDPKRRRGRRRGGRGRGRSRRERSGTSAPAADESPSVADAADFDDDFSEILFEEDQEDFVSVSAASLKAQRRVREEPPAPTSRKVEPDEIDDEEDDDVEKADVPRDESGDRPRRGRRGRRGRGRGREDAREPVRTEDRPAAHAERPARDENDMDDDDIEDDDLELSDFGDSDDDDEVPRRSDKSRTEPARGGSSRSDRPARDGQGPARGRGRDDREGRGADPAERPRRQPVREPRPAAAPAAEGEGRRGPRPPRIAAEFQDIPTWEEAIGSLAIRTPTEEHARRAESRGRRDGGGRPPRRRN